MGTLPTKKSAACLFSCRHSPPRCVRGEENAPCDKVRDCFFPFLQREKHI